jgi:light-regulated signal transduction histidine kinase (bacteriophytochrome)
VKYSPAGGAIHVSVHHEPAGTIRLEVEDSGPGIAQEHAGKIFDRFYRLEDSRSRQAGGAGLGLAIAQWAVRVHGGDIRLEQILPDAVQDFDAFYRQRSPEPATSTILVAAVDCKGIPMVKRGRKNNFTDLVVSCSSIAELLCLG